MAHIELRHVSFEYAADAGAVAALRDVSLQVAASQLVCIVGRSGCGKTTLLNLVAGFLAPTRGDVLLGGRPVAGQGF
ncbi:MAG TPA: ATP-binding cassette domain-containing protein, partial [Methylomirabilota bacterium]|nr:ATP-binding cassette domain-containing protein [Methylomirabilota bacterium]